MKNSKDIKVTWVSLKDVREHGAACVLSRDEVCLMS